jgi:hypothetical protein
MPSGSEVITPTKGGQYKYTLSCDGVNGNATKSVSLIVPIPVYPTSFQNAKLIDQPSSVLPVTMDGGAEATPVHMLTLSRMVRYLISLLPSTIQPKSERN